MKLNNLSNRLKLFYKPLLILTAILLSILIGALGAKELSSWIVILAVALGSLRLFYESAKDILRGKFTLDYIALLAITVSVLTGQFLVGAIIVLMLTGGQTLEDYGVMRAKRSLTALVNRIPNQVIICKNLVPDKTIAINEVNIGDSILIRRGEVIPLDGKLISDDAFTDESSLTGEPYEIKKLKGDEVRSGTVNTGNVMILEVTRKDKDSTYKKIIEMVKNASEEKAPLVRLADKYSTLFTIITLCICAVAWWSSGDFSRVLAVLVIATPCPLILATPIALMGGMNAAAKKRIIIKSLASLERLSQVMALIFDKTGTLTLGKPRVTKIDILDPSYKREQIIAIAESIERNSLHPVAKAIVKIAQDEKISQVRASEVIEVIGSGMQGTVGGKRYELTLSKMKLESGIGVDMYQGECIARFIFEDEVKRDAKGTLNNLIKRGMKIFIYTGDKEQEAQKIVQQLKIETTIKARCTPEDKKKGIEDLQSKGIVTAMIGDGINDAPALALADVGMVFANEEQTAASEAADIIFLGGDLELVVKSHSIAQRSVNIARQSILWGIGLSIVGMVMASKGMIPPFVGAFAQEAIDVAVIINALRASK